MRSMVRPNASAQHVCGACARLPPLPGLPRCSLPSHAPSVRRALPPVGVHSSELQLGHTTTVWLWLKMVVLHR